MKNRFLYRLYLWICDFRDPFFDKLRSKIVKTIAAKSSENILIKSGTFIQGYENLSLENNISINQNCFISADGGLKIGEHVSIGHNVSIHTTNHNFKDSNEPIRNQGVNYQSVNIGNNVWIGANVTILPGVNIKNNVVIGAGSVVTKSNENENTLIVGNPAKEVKSI